MESILKHPTRQANAYFILTPDHPLWEIVLRNRDPNTILQFSWPINVTREEYETAEHDLTRRVSETESLKQADDDIIGNDIYIPKRPDDLFIARFNKLIRKMPSYSVINIHIGTHINFFDSYFYNNVLKSLDKAKKKNLIVKTILNGQNMTGRHLELALTPSLLSGYRGITADSSVCITINLIDALNTDAATKAVNENDKIFQFYNKESPQIAALLKQKETETSDYLYGKIMETMLAELERYHNDIHKINPATLIEKTPDLSIEALKEKCSVHLSAQQCISYGLFSKIIEKQKVG